MKLLQTIFLLLAILSPITTKAQYDLKDFDHNWQPLFDFPAVGFEYNPTLQAISYDATSRQGTSIFIKSQVFDSAQWHITISFDKMLSPDGFLRYYVASSSKYFQSSHAIYLECVSPDRQLSLCEQTADGNITTIIQTPPIPNNTKTQTLTLRRECNGTWHLKSTADPTTYTATHPTKINSQYAGIRVRMDQDTPTLLAIHSMKAQGKKTCGTTPTDPDTPTTDASTAHSIVFTEIMADPTPSASLPEVEYLEIYNRTDSAIDLTDYRLYVGASYGTLYPYVLEPHSYALLCSEKHILQMANYANLLPVESFKTLINDGRALTLCTPTDTQVAWLDYSSDWYEGDVFKSEGGYSLERKDINNLHISRHNFAPTINEQGGTPGSPNSIATNNPDTILPTILWTSLSNGDSLKIAFNKEMRFDITCFTTQDFTLDTINTYPPHNSTLTIPLDIEDFDMISLNISGLACVSDISLPDTLIEFHVTELPQEHELLINELMYAPSPDAPKYIELYNASDKHIDLSTLSLSKFTPEGKFTTPQRLTTEPKALAPHALAIISTSFDAMHTAYTLCPEAIKCTLTTEMLLADGGHIALTLRSGILIDSLSYNDHLHNPWVTETQGIALEKIDPTLTIFSPDNWTSAASTANFATAGCPNSNTPNPNIPDNTTNKHFYLEYEAFTPNNDAWQDHLPIHYTLPTSDFLCTIKIYSPTGNYITTLIDSETLPTAGTLTWNGTTSAGDLLPIGIYVLVIEALHPNGTRINQRLVAVLS